MAGRKRAAMILGRAPFLRLVLVCAPLIMEAAGEPAFAQDCDRGSTGEASACWNQALKTADADLNQIYRQAMNDSESQEEKDTLREAQRAWIKFRDAHCQWRQTRCGQGTMCAPVMPACLALVTAERVNHLKRDITR